MEHPARKPAQTAVIGAAYAALTLLLAPISYGPVQFRAAEALCVMPALMPGSAWGLFIGCAAANLLSAAGPLDVVFGSLATLCACLCAAAIGRRGEKPLSLGRCMAVCLMPALWNGPVVGCVLAYAAGGAGEGLFALAGLICLQVAAGELGVLFLLGLPLLRLLPRLTDRLGIQM